MVIMRKLFLSICACAAMVLGLSSCNDTMDDKADVEAGWTVLPAPTATVAVSATTFSDATITLVASDTVNIAEYGVQYATSEDFSDGVFSAAETISKDAVEISISNLAEKTKYYIRPYVITLNGNTVFGDAVTTTTPAAPIFSLEGIYTALDYSMDDNYDFVPGDGTYEVTVAFAEGSTTAVSITNLWDGGETIVGTYDSETGLITVASDQAVMEHPNYGTCYEFGVDDNLEEMDNMTLKFTSLGGSLVSGYYGVYCSAGSFGISYTSMKHK